jgi:predicted RNase H-like nuclease
MTASPFPIGSPIHHHDTRQQVIREVHPEVSFWEMTGGRLAHGKKTLPGERERVSSNNRANRAE